VTHLVLEDSIIFVSDNLALLSNAVLGLETLIRPLVYRFHVIPILSDEQLDLLEMPLPILTGITSISHYLLQKEGKSLSTEKKVWVYLDGNIIKGHEQCVWPGKRATREFKGLINKYKSLNRTLEE
jgi:hypothetical protein